MEIRIKTNIHAKRKPFEGVWNIVRFNWHFYVLASAIFLGMLLFVGVFPTALQFWLKLGLFLAISTMFISLLVSFYVYDCSNLYQMSWLDDVHLTPSKIVNIHAGFDETSALLKQRFESAEFRVFDFYDPEKHTEISIQRARKAYPPYPNTQSISTQKLPLENASADAIFGILAIHEIRDDAERTAFFHELHRTLAPNGKVIIVEHLRDVANFLAYTIGFFHFHARKTWLQNFEKAQFKIVDEKHITPFIRVFVLEKMNAEL